MDSALHRHDISDHVWSLLEPLLPGRKGVWGGKAKDNRLFINAVFWILRTGAPWRDLPPEYGDWKNTHRRFCRWRDKGIWEHILSRLMDMPDFEWLLIDSTYCKVHPHAAGARGGNEAIGRNKRGLNTKIHLAVDAHGMPVRFFVTSGTTADCTIAAQLIEGFQAEYLLADRGCDTDAIILKAADEGMTPVIPPKKNRKELREFDKYLYKLRHLVENAFLLLKRWRGIATR
ncbi:IS5 family transposase, partial [uncultured Desulfovibrio sp.]|uniref:IS5 family transposase n=1 Tax=uncultured Desulfovibrio sp. TaxID=167968 RepID=UPI00263905D1